LIIFFMRNILGTYKYHYLKQGRLSQVDLICDHFQTKIKDNGSIIV
jgi:hypothetical protein